MIVTRTLGIARTTVVPLSRGMYSCSMPYYPTDVTHYAYAGLPRALAVPGIRSVYPVILISPFLTTAINSRNLQIQSIPASSEEILNAQRLRRPSSPHFQIYQPQITWYGSIINRVTGVGLSAGL